MISCFKKNSRLWLFLKIQKQESRARLLMRRQSGICLKSNQTAPLGGACPQVIMVPTTLHCSPRFLPMSHLPSCPYCCFPHGQGNLCTPTALPNVKNRKDESSLIFLIPGCLHLPTSLSNPVDIFSPFPWETSLLFCSLGGKK